MQEWYERRELRANGCKPGQDTDGIINNKTVREWDHGQMAEDVCGCRGGGAELGRRVGAERISIKTRAYFRALCRRRRRRYSCPHAGRGSLPAMGAGRRR